MTADSQAKENQALPWLAAISGPIALFGPVLLRGEALFWGAPLLQFTPWRVAAARILRSGQVPLWNPWLGMGAPLLANYQSALLYPPNLILMILDPALGATLLVMLHLIWAGVGMMLLSKRLGFDPLGQAVAAVTFSLSSYLVGRSGFLSINATAAWLPWIVLAAEKLSSALSDGRGWQRVLKQTSLLSIAIALQWLAGHAQMAWYSLIFVAAWLGWRSRGRWNWRRMIRAEAGLLGASALAFAMAAAQLLPTLEYLHHSARASGLDESFALSYSFWPWRILGFLAPNLFGSPATGDYWGFANYWEDALYIGVLPLLLAMGGLIAGRAERRPLRGFLAVAGALALLFALGRNTPIFPILFRHVPTFGLFQAPTRWNLILTFSLALLAAAGSEAWRPATGRWLYWLRLGTAGAVSIALTASMTSRALGMLNPTFAPAIAGSGVLLALAGALALLRRDPAGWAWTRAALAFTLADLLIVGWPLNPSEPSALQRERSRLVGVAGGEHRLYMPADLQDSLMFERFFRFDGFQPDFNWERVRESGLPNLPILDGLSSANNFDPILSQRYVDFMQALDQAEPGHRLALMEWMDIGWRAGPDPTSEAGVKYSALDQPSRVHLVPEVRWEPDSELALAGVMDPLFDPWQEVILEGVAPSTDRIGGQGEAMLRDGRSANQVEVSTDAPRGGWLVLADSWYPGWHAALDGEPVQLYIANALFRAVWIPPGDHGVTFYYRPYSFILGVGLSLAGWSLALIPRRRWRDER